MQQLSWNTQVRTGNKKHSCFEACMNVLGCSQILSLSLLLCPKPLDSHQSQAQVSGAESACLNAEGGNTEPIVASSGSRAFAITTTTTTTVGDVLSVPQLAVWRGLALIIMIIILLAGIIISHFLMKLLK